MFRAPRTSRGGAAAGLVRHFLAGACQARLTLDLGESLEAAAPGFSRLREGLSALAACFHQATAAAAPETAAPATPEHWLGLPGWTWVTGVLETVLQQLSNPVGK